VRLKVDQRIIIILTTIISTMRS